MVFPGHIAAGYLTALAVVTITAASYVLTPTEQTLLLTAGALLGDAPDTDVIFSFLKKKSVGVTSLKGHRDHLTHAPVLWLILGAIVWLCSASSFGKVLGLLIWLCPWSHFVCDSMYSNVGIKWLWPFSTKEMTTMRQPEGTFPATWKDLFSGYSANPLMYIELSVTLAAIIAILYRNF